MTKERLSSFIGIDYGAKLAGTTAVAYCDNGTMTLHQSAKKQNADHFITRLIDQIQPHYVFIDAPLSLPIVYQIQAAGSDYFYRQCDRELKAMSPMFLGGLTARAMQLKAQMEATYSLKFIEVYPAQLVKKRVYNSPDYKQKGAALNRFLEHLKSKFPVSEWQKNPANWHQLDALLAWWSGYRFLQSEAEIAGNKQEGVIII